MVATLLDETGEKEVTGRLLKFLIEAPVSLDQFWTTRSEMSETLRDKLAGLTSDQLAQIARPVKEAVHQFFPEHRMRFPCDRKEETRNSKCAGAMH